MEHIVAWLAKVQPDIVALQETKVQDEQFPHDALKALGYTALFAGQKAYNGVAVLSRVPGHFVRRDLPDFDDSQRRVLVVRYGRLLVVNVYVPNGSAVGTDKYIYKLEWLRHLGAYIRSLLDQGDHILVLGDFNIAPDDRDVHDPVAWAGQVLVSAPERAALGTLLSAGLDDVFRKFDQPPKSYTWWDYRGGAFRRNHGLRIDLLLADSALAASCSSCEVDLTPRAWAKPSDHAPVIGRFDIDLESA